MKSYSGRIIVAAVIVLLLAVIVTSLRPKPVAVDIAKAETAPLEQKVVDQGHARIRERYTVSAPVAGTLARIELREGDPVEPGMVVARLLPLASPLLDPRARDVAGQRLASAEAAQRQSQVSLERAQQLSQTAERELSRIKTLFSRQAATQSQLDSANAEARVRQSEVSAARFAEQVAAHGVDEAKAALETFSSKSHGGEQLEVTSPIHGRVLHVLKKSEGVVAAGTELIEVGDPRALELVADILSQDAVAVTPGMAARAVHWGGDGPLAARVRRIEPAAFTRTSALGVEEQRVNVVLDLESPEEQWRTLGDGFATELEITTWSKQSALQVPTSTLFRDGDGWAVFAVENGRASKRQVELGHRAPLQTEVLGGIASGEPVILHPGASVKSGIRVEAR